MITTKTATRLFYIAASIYAVALALALTMPANATPAQALAPTQALPYWSMCDAETVPIATMRLCATFDHWRSPSFDDSPVPRKGKRKRPILKMDESDCLYLANEFCLPL